ncbi:MAG: lactate utilization protein C [Armatimonadota bacterium]|nr:lactate utilization protein C [Armatimonadota bacterium]
MSRDVILGRIRAAREALAWAAPQGAEPGTAAPASDALPALPPAQRFPDIVGLFVQRARQVGMLVDIVASPAEAARRVASLCGERGMRRAAAWATPDLAALGDVLAAQGIEVLAPGSSVEQVATADLGVTGAEWGIAETATLVLPSGPQQPRLASLLPPVHVAVLAADRIVPDLHALFARVGFLPSALTLITGPSRSADIGLTPVLGAHGPMEVSVVLIRS